MLCQFSTETQLLNVVLREHPVKLRSKEHGSSEFCRHSANCCRPSGTILVTLAYCFYDLVRRIKTGQLQWSSDGIWEAFGYGRTRSLRAAVDDVRFLRALPCSVDRNRLPGIVNLYQNSIGAASRPMRGLSGLRTVHCFRDFSLQARSGMISPTTTTCRHSWTRPRLQPKVVHYPSCRSIYQRRIAIRKGRAESSTGSCCWPSESLDEC